VSGDLEEEAHDEIATDTSPQSPGGGRVQSSNARYLLAAMSGSSSAVEAMGSLRFLAKPGPAACPLDQMSRRSS